MTKTATSDSRQKNSSKLSPHLSKSLTNLSPKNVSLRPPQNPRSTNKRYSRKPAFEQLSPITGSSPENPINEKSQSSPSKIPRSTRSQPTSRRSSPARGRSSSSEYSSRQNSRPGSNNASRNASRDTSPTKGQTRIPIKNSHRDVSAKVNSYNKSNKPKVPQKPSDTKYGKGKLSRKQSIGKIQPSKLDKPSTSRMRSSANADVITEYSVEDDDREKFDDNNSSKRSADNKTAKDRKGKSKGNDKTKDEDIIEKADVHKSDSSSKLSDLPTATAVVSSATTAAQPLKLDANIEDILKEELIKQFANDGRVFSATSVSSAMNKMNDTVLNSQALLKDNNFSKLSPAASAIIALSNENHKGNKALDTKSATTALPTIESIHKKLDTVGQNINNSFSNSNKVHMESIENTVKNNINKSLTPDHNSFSGSYSQRSANERLRDAQALVTSDVKPIKILVKEKPSEIEVQSGNVRLPSNVTNGLSAAPR